MARTNSSLFFMPYTAARRGGRGGEGGGGGRQRDAGEHDRRRGALPTGSGRRGGEGGGEVGGRARVARAALPRGGGHVGMGACVCWFLFACLRCLAFLSQIRSTETHTRLSLALHCRWSAPTSCRSAWPAAASSTASKSSASPSRPPTSGGSGPPPPRGTMRTRRRCRRRS